MPFVSICEDGGELRCVPTIGSRLDEEGLGCGLHTPGVKLGLAEQSRAHPGGSKNACAMAGFISHLLSFSIRSGAILCHLGALIFGDNAPSKGHDGYCEP